MLNSGGIYRLFLGEPDNDLLYFRARFPPETYGRPKVNRNRYLRKIVLIKRRFIAKNKRKPVFFSIFSLFLLFSGSFSLFSRFRWKLGASRQFLTPWKSRVEKTQHKMNYRKLNEILIFIKSFCELSFHTLGAVPLIFYLYMNLSGLTPPNSVMKNIKGTVCSRLQTPWIDLHFRETFLEMMKFTWVWWMLPTKVKGFPLAKEKKIHYFCEGQHSLGVSEGRRL